MGRSTTATVSLGALRHNLARARALAPASRVWAVVKADAYGHGLSTAIAGFADADGLALLEWEQALRLRAQGWRKRVLMLEGAFEPADLALARNHVLDVVVHDAAQVGWLEALGEPGGAPLNVFLKINSGMNRLGVAPADAGDLHRRLAACPAVGAVALMTHFADADVPGGATDAIGRFEAATRDLPGERTLANSAALFDWPQTRADWVRPGIALYGASPFAGRDAAALGLMPAMTLSASLIAVRRLARGDSLGYGSTFTADRPMRVGIVDCGYADGYPRHAPTGTPVAVAGVATRTLGRVSMDMLAVDLEPVAAAGVDAGVGAPVELWGRRIGVDAVATAAGTIGYELLCAIAARVRRATVD